MPLGAVSQEKVDGAGSCDFPTATFESLGFVRTHLAAEPEGRGEEVELPGNKVDSPVKRELF